MAQRVFWNLVEHRFEGTFGNGRLLWPNLSGSEITILIRHDIIIQRLLYLNRLQPCRTASRLDLQHPHGIIAQKHEDMRKTKDYHLSALTQKSQNPRQLIQWFWFRNGHVFQCARIICIRSCWQAFVGRYSFDGESSSLVLRGEQLPREMPGWNHQKSS